MRCTGAEYLPKVDMTRVASMKRFSLIGKCMEFKKIWLPDYSSTRYERFLRRGHAQNNVIEGL